MLATIDRIEDGFVFLELAIDITLPIKKEKIPYSFKIGDVVNVIIIQSTPDDYEVVFWKKLPHETEKRLEELANLRTNIKSKKH